MESELEGAIRVLISRVDQKTKELSDLKRMVNSLSYDAGGEPIYSESELAEKGSSALTLTADKFYGKAPTSAAREYLDMRGTAIPLDEILSALERGGFDFNAQNWAENARRRNLASAMGKNSNIFHRLPNDTWGLTKNYPALKNRKTTKESTTAESKDGDEEE